MSTAECPDCGAEVDTDAVFTQERCPECDTPLATLVRLAQTEVAN